MSYILDALRRADAERQRGQAPGLQQVTHEALGPAPASRSGLVGWAVALGLLVAAAGGGAWWWLHPAPTPAPTALPVPIVAAPAPAPTPAPAPAPAPAASIASVAAVPSAAAPVRAAAPALAKAPAPRPSAPASAAAPRPVLASALPEPLRSAVLRLQVGGVVHSQERSQSFVMVGGQIAHEGDTLAPGILLERIGPRALLLRVAEQAVELPL